MQNCAELTHSRWWPGRQNATLQKELSYVFAKWKQGFSLIIGVHFAAQLFDFSVLLFLKAFFHHFNLFNWI